MPSERAQAALMQDSTLLRTASEHRKDVESSEIQFTNTMKATGVKTFSPFSCLSYFNHVESMTPDIMHDVLEGVAKRELGLLIDFFIQQKWISLDILNQRISTFDYQ
jgi:hypothetical protein